MNIKLKELIIKRARESGCNIDGDIIKIFDKTYFVDYLNDRVEEVK